MVNCHCSAGGAAGLHPAGVGDFHFVPEVAGTQLVHFVGVGVGGVVDAGPESGWRVEADGQRCVIVGGDLSGVDVGVTHEGVVLVVDAVADLDQGQALVAEPHEGHVVHQVAGRGAVLAYGEGEQSAVEVRVPQGVGTRPPGRVWVTQA